MILNVHTFYCTNSMAILKETIQIFAKLNETVIVDMCQFGVHVPRLIIKSEACALVFHVHAIRIDQMRNESNGLKTTYI